MHGNGCPNLEVVARRKLLEPRPPTRSLTHPCRRSTQGTVKMSRAGARTGGTSSSRTAVLVRPRWFHSVGLERSKTARFPSRWSDVLPALSRDSGTSSWPSRHIPRLVRASSPSACSLGRTTAAPRLPAQPGSPTLPLVLIISSDGQLGTPIAVPTWAACRIARHSLPDAGPTGLVEASPMSPPCGREEGTVPGVALG